MKQTGKIGIIGGGQLGQMLTEAAIQLGFTVIVLDPTPNAPASQVGATQIVRDYSESAIQDLAKQVDYLTTEFEEGLEPTALKRLADLGTSFSPDPEVLGLLLDKLVQKDYLAQQQVAMGPYRAIETAEDAYQTLEDYGGKMLIKTRRGGYDGYGNRVVDSRESIDVALADFAGKAVYAEQFVSFQKELAVMVARSHDGTILPYPVVETIQKDNICHVVLAPAAIDTTISEQATTIATTIAQAFTGSGVFGIEMFLTNDNQVLLNEVAPRVHNSGHYTIEACATSQFEQHIRAVTHMPLGPTTMIVPAAVMINILGERNGPVALEGVEQAEADPYTKVHMYGKSPTKIGRKMGHLTSTGDTLEEARHRAEAARTVITT